MSIEQANLLLGGFGDLIGLAGLCLDERGYACLTFDDLTVNIEYEPMRDALALFSWLGEVKGGRTELFAELLEANLRAYATGDATLGYERAGDGIVILERLPLNGLDVSDFQQRLEAYLTMAGTWRERLGTHEAAPASSGADRLSHFLRA
jgi:hypothetical protein